MVIEWSRNKIPTSWSVVRSDDLVGHVFERAGLGVRERTGDAVQCLGDDCIARLLARRGEEGCAVADVPVRVEGELDEFLVERFTVLRIAGRKCPRGVERQADPLEFVDLFDREVRVRLLESLECPVGRREGRLELDEVDAASARHLGIETGEVEARGSRLGETSGDDG